jgi:hypothetical protein
VSIRAPRETKVVWYNPSSMWTANVAIRVGRDALYKTISDSNSRLMGQARLDWRVQLLLIILAALVLRGIFFVGFGLGDDLGYIASADLLLDGRYPSLTPGSFSSNRKWRTTRRTSQIPIS